MQRWLAECKEVRTKNSRNKSGSILHTLLRQHIMRIEEHETIAFLDILSQESMAFIIFWIKYYKYFN